MLSAQHCNEDNFAAFKLAAVLGTDKLYLAALGGWEGDEILRSAGQQPEPRGRRSGRGPRAAGPRDADPGRDRGRVEAVLALGGSAAEDATAARRRCAACR